MLHHVREEVRVEHDGAHELVEGSAIEQRTQRDGAVRGLVAELHHDPIACGHSSELARPGFAREFLRRGREHADRPRHDAPVKHGETFHARWRSGSGRLVGIAPRPPQSRQVSLDPRLELEHHR